jgi:peptide/nickel transport system permease protein
MTRRLPATIIVCMALLAVLTIAAVAAPWLSPHDPLHQSLLLRLRPPGSATAAAGMFPLGTDDLGRDLLSRIIYGARASLIVATLSVSVSLVVGTLLGLIAGRSRWWIAALVMRLVDTMLSVPAILLAVLTVAVLGPGFLKLILVLGLTRWPRYTRVAYASTLQVVALPYIRAAEMAGAGSLRILLRHVLPNIAGPLMVVATSEFGLMILFEAGLSFLGLGIQPPSPSWGSIMSAGREYVARAWWMTVFPGVTLFVLVLCVNLLGDWLRDRLDPQSVGPQSAGGRSAGPHAVDR